MKLLARVQAFIRKPFFSDYRTVFGLWMFIAVIAAIFKINRHNNFTIFRYVFWHTIEQTPLYISYPEYVDTNHYGPLFSLIVAPFAIFPDKVGFVLWSIALALCLYYAIRKLPIEKKSHIFIYWFCAHDLLTALFMSQFNIAIAAIILATFYCIQKEKDIWAALFIVLGTFVKLYGIVGLAFFFFSRHKLKFSISLIGWSIVMFVAPMLISSPDYIISQYAAWWESLIDKGALNMFATHQNISLLGMIRKISQDPSYSDIWIILTGVILFALPYLRISQYKHLAFRYTLMASVLLCVVLFSTGSESSSYIIAFIGIAIWYVAAPWQRNKWDIALMVFAFIFASFSNSDIIPRFIKKGLIQPYALKALPCVLIWLKLVYEMCVRNYAPKKVTDE